jgi:TolA-binding protein
VFNKSELIARLEVKIQKLEKRISTLNGEIASMKEQSEIAKRLKG